MEIVGLGGGGGLQKGSKITAQKKLELQLALRTSSSQIFLPLGKS